jgi:hypothetical protein
VLLLALLVTSLAARPATAQAVERCFPETGYCISGPIRAYWERNGGLPAFGYPISPQQSETVEGSWTGPVQWFERDRLEDHANEGLGVLAGRLGARYLELTGRPWQQFPAQQPSGSPECRSFPQTGFNACGWFLGYWERNGGLERFGYPISPGFEEQIEGRTYNVQYFERRRMEYHPENAPPYDVLLGLLGRVVRGIEQRPPSTSATRDPQIRGLLALSVDLTTRNLNLVRVDRDGADPVIVNADARPAFAPSDELAWAPDGSAVAFVDRYRTHRVFVLSADGQRLDERPAALPPDLDVETVAWSPTDATLLLSAYRSTTPPQRVLALLRPDDSLQLLDAGRAPRWSPDGTRILFLSPQPDGSDAVMVMNADGSGSRSVGSGSGPAWSPDGRQIVYSDPQGWLTTVAADGSGARRLRSGRSPSWSPDGSRIAFDVIGGDLRVMYADGADPRVVLHKEGIFTPIPGYTAITWSPDGAQLAYRFALRNDLEAGVINLDGSGQFILSGAAVPPRWGSFAP